MHEPVMKTSKTKVGLMPKDGDLFDDKVDIGALSQIEPSVS